MTLAPALVEGVMRPMAKTGSILLYVEDEESDRFLMHRAFARAGLAGVLRLVNDGQSAVDYLTGSIQQSDRETHPLPALCVVGLEAA